MRAGEVVPLVSSRPKVRAGVVVAACVMWGDNTGAAVLDADGESTAAHGGWNGAQLTSLVEVAGTERSSRFEPPAKGSSEPAQTEEERGLMGSTEA